jgi:hypothetical protein
MSPTAHSTDLYTIGKGIAKFDRLDTDGLPTGLRDLGNCTLWSLLPAKETLEHYSSREGIKTLDKEVTLSRKLTGKLTLDEFDSNNLAMALNADVAGDGSMSLLVSGDVEGELDLWMTNDVGAKFHIQIWKAKLAATSELGFITDEWGVMEFEFTVEDDYANHPDSRYGLITPLGLS